jgi:soluble lytic murein transglycosylase-like protein
MERLNSIEPSFDQTRRLFIIVLIMVFLIPFFYQRQFNLMSVLGNFGDSQITLSSFALGRHPKQQPDMLSEDQSSLNADKKGLLFWSIIQRAADRHDVDPVLVKAIIFAESGYNPKAISGRGAQGLMQLMPETASELGVEDCFDPEDNIHGGVKYFRLLLDKFDGDVILALAAYNAGSRKVRQYQGIPPFKRTQHYVRKVLEYYQLYKEQMAEESGKT